MRLSTDAITAIKKPEVRIRLAIELKCTDQSIVKYIKANEFNGPLTTAGALKVIREETKLSDVEILEEEKEPTKVA
jgi:hypothetical protein